MWNVIYYYERNALVYTRFVISLQKYRIYRFIDKFQFSPRLAARKIRSDSCPGNVLLCVEMQLVRKRSDVNQTRIAVKRDFRRDEVLEAESWK